VLGRVVFQDCGAPSGGDGGHGGDGGKGTNMKEITGKHVLIMFLAFFGVIIAVNGAFIYLSQKSWVGLETEDAFRKGVKYNQQLSKMREQNRRGWHMKLERQLMPEGFILTARPRDKNGEPLTNLVLSAELKRPTHTGEDQTFILEEKSPGLYRGANARPVARGKWYLFVTAIQNDKIVYRSKNDFFMK
jgi:nitrogen fixation protein FixH